MKSRRSTSLFALVAALAVGVIFLMGAVSVILDNHDVPDEFGMVTPKSDNAYAWIAIAVAVLILAVSGALLTREIRRRRADYH